MENSKVTGFSKSLILFAMKLSAKIYEGNEIEKTGIDVIYSNKQNEIFLPVFSVCKKDESMYVVIRGTDSKEDWITNFNYKNVYHQILEENVSFHSGYYQAANNVLEKVRPFISNHSGPIYFTGHSYGGSVASILCALLKSEDKTKDYNAIAFGPSPSMSKLPQIINEKIASVVQTHDFVTRTSIANAYKKYSSKSTNHIKKSIKLIGKAIKLAKVDNGLKFLGNMLKDNARPIAEFIKDYKPTENEIRAPSGVIYQVHIQVKSIYMDLANEEKFHNIEFDVRSLTLHTSKAYLLCISRL